MHTHAPRVIRWAVREQLVNFITDSIRATWSRPLTVYAFDAPHVLARIHQSATVRSVPEVRMLEDDDTILAIREEIILRSSSTAERILCNQVEGPYQNSLVRFGCMVREGQPPRSPSVLAGRTQGQATSSHSASTGASLAQNGLVRPCQLWPPGSGHHGALRPSQARTRRALVLGIADQVALWLLPDALSDSQNRDFPRCTDSIERISHTWVRTASLHNGSNGGPDENPAPARCPGAG